VVSVARELLMELPIEYADLARQVTKWSKVCFETQRIPEYIRTAIRNAMTGTPGPVYFECPADIVSQEVEFDFEADLASARSIIPISPAGDEAAVGQAAELLCKSRQPVLLVGSELLWSREPQGVQGLLGQLPMPTYLNGLARGALAADHACRLSLTRREALGSADVVIVAGASLDFRFQFGQPPSWPRELQIIQIDVDATEIGRNRSADLGVVGDPGVVLGQIARKIDDDRPRDSWINSLRELESKREEDLEMVASSDVVPIHPLRLVREIRDAIKDRDPIVVIDGGYIGNFAPKLIGTEGLGKWLDPGPLGCLGVGPPFAIGAKMASPERDVVLISGDGAFGLNCMEFDTMVRHGINVVCVVSNNGRWGSDASAPYWRDQPIADVLNRDARYDLVVEALGGQGERISSPDGVCDAIRRGLDSGAPYCIDVVVTDEHDYYAEVRGSYTDVETGAGLQHLGRENGTAPVAVGTDAEK